MVWQGLSREMQENATPAKYLILKPLFTSGFVLTEYYQALWKGRFFHARKEEKLTPQAAAKSSDNKEKTVDKSTERGYNKGRGESLALENQRYGRNKDTLVNKSILKVENTDENLIILQIMPMLTEHFMSVLKKHWSTEAVLSLKICIGLMEKVERSF